MRLVGEQFYMVGESVTGSLNDLHARGKIWGKFLESSGNEILFTFVWRRVFFPGKRLARCIEPA